MKCKIALQERLKDLRVERKLKLEELSALTGISKSALGNYENDDYMEFNHGNLITLANFYNVSTDYLLCLTENRNHSNTDLTELHLSDDMITLLKSGSINNRLLSELVTNIKFKELIADVEMFVDGIATMRFDDLNTFLEDLRTKIINQTPDISDDHILRTLKASQIQEDDFFCHITHKTWDLILKDIRQNHKNDIKSISDTDTTYKLIREIQETMQISGNKIDPYIMASCKAFGLNYKKLSENEINILRKLFKKSSLIKYSGINFRQKKR